MLGILAADALSSSETVQQLFTWENLLTLGGSVLAVVVVTNSIQSIARMSQTVTRILALLIAMLTQLVAARYAAGAGGQKWIIAVLNGFLVYSSALGLNQTVVGGDHDRGDEETRG